MKIRIIKTPQHKKSFGGHTNGTNFSNGVISINSGGLHSTNPYEGVLIGVDNLGIPNLVEEGELIWKDFVFSNRIKVPKEIKKSLRLRGNTFADVAKNALKESEERPNDPISKRGLDDIMTKLSTILESMKAVKYKDKNIKGNKFYKGGNTTYPILGMLYDNLNIPDTNSLNMLNEYRLQELDNLFSDIYKDLPYADTTPIQLNGNYTYKDITPPTEDLVKERLPRARNNGRFSNVAGNFLRYMPAIGSGIAVLTDALGKTNKPDYSNVDLIAEATNNLSTIEPKYIGNYLTYKPMDRNYYLNKNAAQAAGTRNAIIDLSNGNRGAAIAGLLNADYNAQLANAELARQAEEYNMALRERVQGFNRQTDMYNSEAAMKAAIANKKNEELRLKSAMEQAQMRQLIDSQSSAAKSANLTNLFDNLGNIGIDIANRRDRNMLIEKGVLLGLSLDEKKSLGIKSKGGKIRTKKRGLTY